MSAPSQLDLVPRFRFQTYAISLVQKAGIDRPLRFSVNKTKKFLLTRDFRLLLNDVDDVSLVIPSKGRLARCNSGFYTRPELLDPDFLAPEEYSQGLVTIKNFLFCPIPTNEPTMSALFLYAKTVPLISKK